MVSSVADCRIVWSQSTETAPALAWWAPPSAVAQAANRAYSKKKQKTTGANGLIGVMEHTSCWVVCLIDATGRSRDCSCEQPYDDPVKNHSGVILIGETHDHGDGRGHQSLDRTA